jgi:uncharacterized surface protein with fasciclin (FAS1) repeats
MVRFATLVVVVTLLGCDQPKSAAPAEESPPSGGTQITAAEQPAVAHPPVDATNIVSIAGASKDHTTLVAALKAADYVDAVSNAGPLTVFAPTNAAFDKLPKGTVESLVKPEKQAELKEILKYHVTVSTYRQKDFHDGQTLSMANGAKATLHVKDGKVSINDANIIASIPASNGIVHVIDGVLLPPAK